MSLKLVGVLPKRLSRVLSLYGEWLRSIQPQGEGALLASMIRKILLQVGVNLALVVALVVALLLTLVLCGGFYLLYRLGLGQIQLARQQQDFVSAVSHELKTPLTSIRMYGEILREGWASEEKKKRYYDYIHDESERLSRLISNVLQLARMTHNDLQVDLTAHTTIRASTAY